jgi:hypothetical protein
MTRSRDVCDRILELCPHTDRHREAGRTDATLWLLIKRWPSCTA